MLKHPNEGFYKLSEHFVSLKIWFPEQNIFFAVLTRVANKLQETKQAGSSSIK